MDCKHNSLIVFAMLVLLSGCATTPTEISFADIQAKNESLKRAVPERITYEMKDLTSVRACGEDYCISQVDLEQVLHDSEVLPEIINNLQDSNEAMTSAFNNMIVAHTHLEYSGKVKDQAINQLETSLFRERTASAVQKWLERAAFLAGVLIFGKL